MKLGVNLSYGVGPDSDIVAFSDICQHLGCNPIFVPKGQSPPFNTSYVAPEADMCCPCHGSIYDLTNDAAVIGGPAPYPVPRVMLSVDSSGNLHAIGMEPPTIYEHGTPGSTDVLPDLQGGTLSGKLDDPLIGVLVDVRRESSWGRTRGSLHQVAGFETRAKLPTAPSCAPVFDQPVLLARGIDSRRIHHPGRHGHHPAHLVRARRSYGVLIDSVYLQQRELRLLSSRPSISTAPTR